MTMGTFTSDDNVKRIFVGRTDALDAFYRRFAYRHMKNGVYYWGSGGLGKTWILRKIYQDIEQDNTRRVGPVIDFYETKNHTVRGLQETIKSALAAPNSFLAFDDYRRRADNARTHDDDRNSSGAASLEARANREFIHCCERALVGHEVVLLFDSFEYVQQRYVGRWFVKKFLPHVRGLVFAIAGRPIGEYPNHKPADMPDNVLTFPLTGLSSSEVKTYVRDRWREASDDVIEAISIHTQGTPLLVDLILDMEKGRRSEYVSRLATLLPEERIQDRPDLQRGLIGQFTNPNSTNRLIWVIAYLKRRFDEPMLEFLVKNGPRYFPTGEYAGILKSLGQRLYVKRYEQGKSYLLHDEIQRLISRHMLKEYPALWTEVIRSIHDPIVRVYYPSAIETVTPSESKQQLRAEQFGYILGADIEEGLKLYHSYRDEIDKNRDFDFEEQLWGEIRSSLQVETQVTYKEFIDRGAWLRRASLFERVEDHFRHMIAVWPSPSFEMYQRLGHALKSQSNYSEAEEIFDRSLELIGGSDHENIAMVENNLGQLYQETGALDEALVHYARSFRSATIAKSSEYLASAQLNRGSVYSLLGMYSRACSECERALAILDNLPEQDRNEQLNIQRSIFARLHLGTALRHAGDFDKSRVHYQDSLKLAAKNKNREAQCVVLQNLGINEFLAGRQIRRNLLDIAVMQNVGEFPLEQRQQQFDQACTYLYSAWRHLNEALDAAQDADWRKAISDGLNRMAKVYREIDRLEKLTARDMKDLAKNDALTSLQKRARKISLTIEIEYEADLLTPGNFSELGWLEQAMRLFDLSARVAMDSNNYHRSLDSLTELANGLLELDKLEDVDSVCRRMLGIKEYDYQEQMFIAVIEIISAHIEYKLGHLDAAFEKYAQAYVEVAKQGGYATYMLVDRVRDLEWYIQSLPPPEALKWCDFLEDSWLNERTSRAYPELTASLERVRGNIIFAGSKESHQ